MLSFLTLAACTAEDETMDDRGTVRFSLGATRANTGSYVSEATDCELIKWYRVAMTQRGSREIVLCIDKDLTQARELDPLDEIQLNPGSYDVYAFANIDRAYLDGLGIRKGGAVPEDIGTLRYAVPGYFDATPDAEGRLQGTLLSTEAFAAAGGYIPMTSLAPQQVEVSARVSQTFNIEVRRLFAKLEFVFRNPTDEDLQVNSIAVGNMTPRGEAPGSILLMNYEESRDALSLPADLKQATFTHTFASPSQLAARTGTATHSFYVLESRANSITNSFSLDFNVTRKGEAPTGSKEDYMRWALTDPATITLLHRNDWLVLPITLGEWQLRLEARSYPPIGGYPEAEVTGESDEFNVKFRYMGEFSIRPSLRKYGTTDWIYLDDTSVVESYDLTVDTTSDGLTDIFKKKPVKKGSEIIGTIKSGVKGTALVTLTVHIDDGTGFKRTLTRKLYITI